MKVTIIGTGNVAYVLGRKFLAAGLQIGEVYGRDEAKVLELASDVNGSACFNLNKINQESDIYLIAISDSSVSVIAEKLKLKDKLVAHTAGSVSRNVLKPVSENYGVIYPLQSLRREIPRLPEIPVLLDANNSRALEKLNEFCLMWSENVSFANDDDRLKTHVSAVIVNNFTNHLFTLTEEFCNREHLNFKVLYPLIEETINRIKDFHPSAVQTGPAIRKDFSTIEKHLSVLEDHRYLRELYKMLSSNITDYYRVTEE